MTTAPETKLIQFLQAAFNSDELIGLLYGIPEGREILQSANRATSTLAFTYEVVDALIRRAALTSEFFDLLRDLRPRLQPSIDDVERVCSPRFRNGPTREISADWLMQQKLDGFVGRRWLLERVENFISTHDRGYVRVDALPGMGKTSFAARLVCQHGWIHHFFTRTEGVVTFEQFLANLHAQLSRAGIVHFRAPNADDHDHGRYLQELLIAAARTTTVDGARPLVVVLDGVDEADSVRSGATPMYLPTTLPSGVRFVVLARSHTLQALRVDPPFAALTIDPDAAENLADIKEFLARAAEQLARAPGSPGHDAVEFAKRVLDASEGNFMYVRSLVSDVKLGRASAGDLPRGLRGYYERHWESMRAHASTAEWEDVLLPPLRVLTVAEDPLTLEQLSRVLTIGRPQGPLRKADIRAALSRWGQFLSVEPGPPASYRLYHRSFQEFLQAKEELLDDGWQQRVHGWLARAILQDV